MLWLLTQSVRQNVRKYWLAIVGVAASVLVSAIGISGSQAIWRMAQYPMSQILGGDMMIIDARVALRGSQTGIYSDGDLGHISEPVATELARRALPGAKLTSTLLVPCLYRGTEVAIIQGRSGEMDAMLYAPRIIAGRQLAPGDAGNVVLTRGRVESAAQTVGQPMTLRLAKAVASDGDVTWNLAEAQAQTFEIVGVYGEPAGNSNLWMPLESLRRQLGTGDLVTYVGVIVDDPATVDASAEKLRAEITKQGLGLQVITTKDMGRMMVADFQKLESLAGYYTPAMCFIAVVIVLATGLALAASRRRELSLLRSIGLSIAALRGLFFAECLIVVALGAAVGTVLAAAVTGSQFGYAVWNLLPAGIVMAISALLTAVYSFVLFSSKGTLRNLRNP